ncbi:acyl carrier protein [Nocardia takedensis]|uniref:acyl carrier protein n=1 Tax=Nocardia takedensis TaxID=259390 RepID=UPI000306C65D|nr:acyl carrier protein [Nocardia takedensis]
MSSTVNSRRVEIKEIVCRIIEIDEQELSEVALFKDDHDVDSLMAIEILAALEKTYGVSIDQGELARMVNLVGVYEVVDEALAR